MALVIRAGLSLATLVIISLVLLYLRLLQGPVVLSSAVELIEEQINAATELADVRLGSVVLTLDDGQGKSGLQLRDIEVIDPSGAKVFAVPVATAQFRFSDLLHGRIQPVSITVLNPETQLVRDRLGRLRVSIGTGDGLPISDERDDAKGTSKTFRGFSDFFAGDTVAAKALERLESIQILGARFSYEDKRSDLAWSTRNASILLNRRGDRAQLTLTIDSIDEGTPGAALRLFAERRRGEDIGRVLVSFGNFRPRDLAQQLPGLDWLGLIEGTVEGQATAFVNTAGQVTEIEGVLVAEDGRILGQGPRSRFDFIELHFHADPARETLRLDYANLQSPAIGTKMSGKAQLRRDSDGTFSGLAGQLDVDTLNVDMPTLFSDTIEFDDGQISFRWDLAGERFEVADARLADGPLVFAVDGRAASIGDEWVTDIRAEATGMTAQDLIEHWPLPAAQNARAWVAENIKSADVPRMLAQMRFGQGDPYVALDFDFTRLRATYLDDMTPIEQAVGRGHMTYNELYLDFSHGQVNPSGERVIELGGSRVAISDFWGDVTPAEINLVAEGPTADILNLIDQPPLGLISRLGLDLGQIGGSARVVTRVGFPLIQDLLLEDIQAAAEAELSDVSTPFAIGEGIVASVSSPALSLKADTREMQLRGPVNVEGAQLSIDWQEVYGTTPGARQMTLKGGATKRLLSVLGAGALPVNGEIPFELELAQTGAQPIAFGLSADLAAATLAVEELDWVKAKGRRGALRATGSLGEGLSLSDFALETQELTVRGKIDLASDGSLLKARFDQFVFRDDINVSADLVFDEGGTMDVRFSNGVMDLSQWSDGLGDEDDGSDPTPVRVQMDLRSLRLDQQFILAPVRGQIEQARNGRVKGAFSGALGGLTPIELTIEAGGGLPGSLKVTGNDAGAALSASSLYEGASGGTLALDATISADDVPVIAGRLLILDMRVRSEATFSRVLRQGGLDEAQQEISTGGIGFDRIEVPFVYNGEIISFEDALATSPALALKASGTVNERTEQLALSGVLSPAYGLTGALDNIPVLREIFSGGRGEGILAMTFTMEGPVEDPSISVNPLSILTPGFLRNIFSRKAGADTTVFEGRIKRDDR